MKKQYFKSLIFLGVIFLGVIFLMSGTKATAASCWDMTPEVVQEKINQQIMCIDAPTPIVATTTDLLVQGDNRATPIRLYMPNAEKNLPVILFIHGGAWVAGNLDTHDNLARYLCAETKAVVVSVGYLNAPAGNFPLVLDQCYDVLLWLIEHASEFSIQVSKLAVVGDSAGGNIAAAICLLVRDRSGPAIGLQVLINPATDLTCNGTLVRQSDHFDSLRWQAMQYVSHADEVNSPYVSPLVAKDLSRLPAACVILAENDTLREMGQAYADRLRSAGVPVQVYCQQGIGHLAGDGARASLKARESLDVAVAALCNVFSKD